MRGYHGDAVLACRPNCIEHGAEDTTVAYLESNPAATGAAPDGHKHHLSVSIAGMSKLGRHRLFAADLTLIAVRVDFPP